MVDLEKYTPFFVVFIDFFNQIIVIVPISLVWTPWSVSHHHIVLFVLRLVHLSYLIIVHLLYLFFLGNFLYFDASLQVSASQLSTPQDSPHLSSFFVSSGRIGEERELIVGEDQLGLIGAFLQDVSPILEVLVHIQSVSPELIFIHSFIFQLLQLVPGSHQLSLELFLLHLVNILSHLENNMVQLLIELIHSLLPSLLFLMFVHWEAVQLHQVAL